MTHGYRCVLPGLLLGLFGILPLMSNRCGAEEVFDPYPVYVDQEGVTARCGPGGDYYRTDPLRHGQRLEVYLETADGWLGIRPPEGSFCWIPADSVTLDSGQSSGRVNEATLAWIGTHLGKARKYLWQVQMPRDEEVTILGRAEREGPDGPQLWYRIVPPSGEFRWVHRDQIVDNPELLLREKPHGEDRLATGTPTVADESLLERSDRSGSRSSHGEPARSVLQQPLASAGDRSDENDSVQLHALHAPDAIPLAVATDPRAGRQAAADIQATADTPPAIGSAAYSPPVDVGATAAESTAGIAAQRALAQPAIGSGILPPQHPPLMTITSQPIVHGIGTASEPSAIVQASNTNWSSDANWVRGSDRPESKPHAAVSASSGGLQTAGTVDALQLELSRRMVASAQAAEVEPLRLAAAEIAQHHASPSERQRAGLLAQRVEQYQDVARRRDTEMSTIPPPGWQASGSPLGSATPPPAGQPAQSAGQLAAGEVAGYLVQVYSARPDSPPFALTDASGRTTHYVSPSPGVNLRRYLNQHITIAGQSGYETGLDTPHVIASTAARSAELR